MSGLFPVFLTMIAALSAVASVSAAEPLRILILDGENMHHDWQATTPLLQKLLRESGRFAVDVATLPAADSPATDYDVAFDHYDAVLSNYNSQRLPPEEFRRALEDFVRGGGGLIAVHAANNSFTEWPQFNEMTGLGGWYGRDKSSGPYVYYHNDKLVRDQSDPGPCGHHGPQHEYLVRTRVVDHPIMADLPAAWLHAKDELYDRLRGPAKNMTILATAYSDPKFEGTGRDEPMIAVLDYGQGRVFHTIMGQADYSMRCVGFTTTLLRGAEWAASGKVTLPVPNDFPTAQKLSSRE